MNKKELIGAVSGRTFLPGKDAAKAVTAVLDIIAEQMKKGEPVSLPGFGCFAVKIRPARMGRNPRTGASIRIAARKTVRFTPGTGLQSAAAASPSEHAEQ